MNDSAISVPLRAKYRNPGKTFREDRKGTVNSEQSDRRFMTSVYGGSNTSTEKRTGNSHGPTPKRKVGKHGALKPRQRSWGPF